MTTDNDRYFGAIMAGVALEAGKFTDADGKTIYNRLNFDRLFASQLHLQTVVRGLSELVTVCSADLVIGAPGDDQRLAEEVANRDRTMQLDIAYLKERVDPNSPGSKLYAYATDADQELVLAKEKLVVIAGEFDFGFTAVKRVLAVPGVADKAIAAIAVWDRGGTPGRIKLPAGVKDDALFRRVVHKLMTPEDFAEILSDEGDDDFDDNEGA